MIDVFLILLYINDVNFDQLFQSIFSHFIQKSLISQYGYFVLVCESALLNKIPESKANDLLPKWSKVMYFQSRREVQGNDEILKFAVFQ